MKKKKEKKIIFLKRHGYCSGYDGRVCGENEIKNTRTLVVYIYFLFFLSSFSIKIRLVGSIYLYVTE